MDTLEWGTSDSGARVGGWRRQGARWLGPPLAVGLAGAGVALAMAAQVLPWTNVLLVGGDSGDSGTTTGQLGLDNLNTVSIIGYHFCWIGLLGSTGLVLTARPAARRAAAGAALGLAAALMIVLAGIIGSIVNNNGLTGPVSDVGGDLPGKASVGPGLFCGCLAVLLVLAAVLVGVRRRAPLLATAAVAVPSRPDEPVDLTVQPALPADERLFLRHDPR